MATFTATIQIGFSSSQLLILDDERRGPALNLAWSDDETAVDRADALLAQNGYRRTTDWTGTPSGDSATVETDGPTTQCICRTAPDGDQCKLVYRHPWCIEHRPPLDGTS